jgi:ribonuclease Z
MKGSFFMAALLAAALTATSNSRAEAAPCLIVTLTGTQGGPQSFNGLAGAGTLVRYGDDANDCGAIKLQFDTGRGTTMRLSQIGIGPEQLNAIALRLNQRPRKTLGFETPADKLRAVLH